MEDSYGKINKIQQFTVMKHCAAVWDKVPSSFIANCWRQKRLLQKHEWKDNGLGHERDKQDAGLEDDINALVPVNVRMSIKTRPFQYLIFIYFFSKK